MVFSKSAYLDFVLYTPDSADLIQSTFVNLGTFSRELAEYLMREVQPGWLVYDVGANLFEFTEIAARKAGPTGAVYSFEPQSALVQGYRLAQQQNNYENSASIHVHEFGLADINGEVPITIMEHNGGAATISPEFQEYSISVVGRPYVSGGTISVKRADSIGLPTTIPDLIKLDIEGAEELFWRGAPDFVKACPRLIVEVGPYTQRWFTEELLVNRKAYSLSGALIEVPQSFAQQQDIVFSAYAPYL